MWSNRVHVRFCCIKPMWETRLSRNKPDSKQQRSNWVQRCLWGVLTSVPLPCKYLPLRGWATWVWDLPLVVWGPGRQAGTWAVWRRRAAGRICWWTLLPPDLTETTCTGHYMPRVSLPATKKNNTHQQNDDKAKHTDMLIKRLKSEPQL